MKIKIQRSQLDAKIPTKSNNLDAGWDFYCITDLEWNHNLPAEYFPINEKYTEEPVYLLKQGEGHIFRTGISIEIPKGWCLVLFDRSGMGAIRKIHRTAGVIDCTYRGEIKVSLINLGQEDQIIRSGDKIIQGLILPVPEVEMIETESLSQTDRGNKGFGSSG